MSEQLGLTERGLGAGRAAHPRRRHLLAALLGDAVRRERAVDIAVSLCDALDPSRNRGRVPLPVTALDVELEGDRARVTLSLDGSKPVRDAQTLDPAAPFSAPETLSEGEAITPAATVYNIAPLRRRCPDTW